MSDTFSEPGSEPSLPTFRHGLQITGTEVLSDSIVFRKKQHLPLVMRRKKGVRAQALKDSTTIEKIRIQQKPARMY